LRSYGALKRNNLVIYKHSIPTGLKRRRKLCSKIKKFAFVQGDHLAPNIDLGGVSGGGVFRVIEDELFARPELAGILAGGSAEFEATFGHPLTCLNADGTMID